MRTAYLYWRRFQEEWLQYIAALFLLVPALLSMLEVVRRYGLGKSFPWQQDAVTYGILTGVFLFFGITQSRNLHLRVTIFHELIRAKGGRAGQVICDLLELFAAVVGLAFCAYFVWYGIPVAERMVLQGRMTESQIVPLWPFFIVFLSGIALMAVSFLFQVYDRIQVLRGADPIGQAIATDESSEVVL